jgi:hypothetical protein
MCWSGTRSKKIERFPVNPENRKKFKVCGQPGKPKYEHVIVKYGDTRKALLGYNG